MILRARLLLLKQDRISILENKLKHLDENEACEIFLTSSRDDANRNRQQLLADLDSALADYGTLAYPYCVPPARHHVLTPSLIASV